MPSGGIVLSICSTEAVIAERWAIESVAVKFYRRPVQLVGKEGREHRRVHSLPIRAWYGRRIPRSLPLDDIEESII